MAKRKPRTTANTTTRAAVAIGTALGNVAGRIDNWLAQRESLTDELNTIIGKAQGMLSSLGEGAAKVQKEASDAVRTVRKTASHRRRKVSAAGRRKKAAETKA